MNKKTITIIAVVAIFIISLAGVLCWGLQPIQKDSVSLKKLNKELGEKYCVPSELPFEGDVECYIVYVMGNMGVVLTRFEASPKRSTGYSIALKDSKRKIYIETGNSITISEETAEGLIIKKYNDKIIKYLFSETETDNKLIILYEIDGKTYQINATYNKDVNSETLKSDIKFLLDQMIM
ncbi:MAG: hypothetical protein K2L70_05855 [Clostridia bacterium]|nr:hypothetical protein [Clostridia bacterium]